MISLTRFLSDWVQHPLKVQPTAPSSIQVLVLENAFMMFSLFRSRRHTGWQCGRKVLVAAEPANQAGEILGI